MCKTQIGLYQSPETRTTQTLCTNKANTSANEKDCDPMFKILRKQQIADKPCEIANCFKNNPATITEDTLNKKNQFATRPPR